MAKRKFKITLFPENMQQMEQHASLATENAKGLICFSYEKQPNIEVGDVISVRIAIDENSYCNFEGEVIDLIPPLTLPPSQEVHDAHVNILKKYMVSDVIDKVSEEYFKGKGSKCAWTVYFRKMS